MTIYDTPETKKNIDNARKIIIKEQKQKRAMKNAIKHISLMTFEAEPNKYHKDDLIDNIIIHVRNTQNTLDAISNANILIKKERQKIEIKRHLADAKKLKDMSFLDKVRLLFLIW